MVRVLIPRSDSVSAKIVAATDFEKYFGSEILNDYIKCGLVATAQCPNVLAVDISAGTGRLKGLYIEDTVADTITGLTACSTNYIYASLARDLGCEPESWGFASNTTGNFPTDSMLLGRVVTNATTVTSVDQTLSVGVLKADQAGTSQFTNYIYGDGFDGCLTVTCGTTTLCTTKYYGNVTINACATLTACEPMLMYVSCTLTINGTLSMTGKGSAGATVAAYCTAGCGGAGGPASTNGSVGCPATFGTVSAAVGFNGIAAGDGGSIPPGGSNSGSAGSVGGNGGPNPGVPGCPGTGGAGASGGAGVSKTCGASAGTLSANYSYIQRLINAGITCSPAAGAGGGRGISMGKGAGGGGGGGGEPGQNPGGPAATGGTGGVGGCGGGGATAGDGGAGGGTMVVFARNIVIGACGTLESNGTAGANGSCSTLTCGVAGATGGGGTARPTNPATGGGGGGGGGGGSHSSAGGGGGGAGGYMWVIYSSINEPRSLTQTTVAGGAAGIAGTSPAAPFTSSGGGGGAGGPANAPGTPGTAGIDATGLAVTADNGTAGSVGVVRYIRL